MNDDWFAENSKASLPKNMWIKYVEYVGYQEYVT